MGRIKSSPLQGSQSTRLFCTGDGHDQNTAGFDEEELDLIGGRSGNSGHPMPLAIAHAKPCRRMCPAARCREHRVWGLESLLSCESLADGEQHLRHSDFVDRGAIRTGEESRRKRAAKGKSRLENNREPRAKTLPLVQPEKPERHLQSAAVQQQNASCSFSRPPRRATRKFGSAKR